MALMVASVPLETKRTISMDGTALATASAAAISTHVGAPKLVPRSSCSRTASSTGS